MSYDLFLFALPSEMTVHLLLSLVTPILWNVKCVFLRKRMSLAKPAGYRQDMLKPADIEFCVQRSDLPFVSIPDIKSTVLSASFLIVSTSPV